MEETKGKKTDKKNNKKKGNMNAFDLCMSVAEIVIGILLLINPIAFTSGIIILFGAVLTIAGIVHVVQYFTLSAAEAAQKKLLANGLMYVIVGLFCVIRYKWLISIFPVITALYGLLILASGILKLERSVDMIRAKQPYWIVALIATILTLLFAVLILCDPFASTEILWTFTGISLLVTAVLDIFTFIFSRKPNQNN